MIATLSKRIRQIVDDKLLCTHCHQLLPYECFSVDRARLCGRRNYCKQCVKAKRPALDKAKVKAYNQQYFNDPERREKRRLASAAWYKMNVRDKHKMITKDCKDCGKTFPLTLEHYYFNRTMNAYHSYCITCCKIRATARIKANPVAHKKYQHQHRWHDHAAFLRKHREYERSNRDRINARRKELRLLKKLSEGIGNGECDDEIVQLQMIGVSS